ncbi:MAG: hypothetical protein HS103_02010 [Anaerolineales bacterium]|nr:hypothetical protein [Anaerolineales bacterium]
MYDTYANLVRTDSLFLFQRCADRAFSEGVNFTNYSRSNNGTVIMIFNHLLVGDFTGVGATFLKYAPPIRLGNTLYDVAPMLIAYVDRAISPQPSIQSGIAHEMGHTLGLYHTVSPYYTPEPGHSYGSAWDVMSSDTGSYMIYPTPAPSSTAIPTFVPCGQWDHQTGHTYCIPNNASALHGLIFKWFLPSHIEIVNAPSMVNLDLKILDSSLPIAANERRVIRVDILGTREFYTVEARRKGKDYDDGLPVVAPVDTPFVLIHRVNPDDLSYSMYGFLARIIDIDRRTIGSQYRTGYLCNNGKDTHLNANDSGAIWVPNDEFVDYLSNIQIRVNDYNSMTQTFNIDVSLGQNLPFPSPNDCP